MLKKNITYTNPFTDQEVTEEHYFHISKADLVEMEMEEHGNTYEKDGQTLTGMQAKLQRIVDSQDGKAIMAEFKDIIRRSYGKKQGDRFLKSPEIWAEFQSSEAFSQMLFELCTDASAAAEFVNKIAPRGLIEQAAKEVRTRVPQVDSADDTDSLKERMKVDIRSEDEVVADPTGLTDETTPRVLTQAEIVEMDADELKSGLAAGRYKLS